MNTISLQWTGAGLIFLAVAHVAFPRRFNWQEELSRLSLLNRQIFWVHTMFIVIVVAFMGTVLLIAPEALLEPSRLGRWVAGGFTLFWALRLIIQWFGYSHRLWWRKPAETVIHLVFTLAWGWLTWLGWTLWRMQLN